jgi:hypothetical protein
MDVDEFRRIFLRGMGAEHTNYECAERLVDSLYKSLNRPDLTMREAHLYGEVFQAAYRAGRADMFSELTKTLREVHSIIQVALEGHAESSGISSDSKDKKVSGKDFAGLCRKFRSPADLSGANIQRQVRREP